jgi:hypothetical protein
MTGFVEPPPKSSTLTIRLPKKLEKTIRLLAKEQNVTISHLILDALHKKYNITE